MLPGTHSSVFTDDRWFEQAAHCDPIVECYEKRVGIPKIKLVNHVESLEEFDSTYIFPITIVLQKIPVV